MTRDHLARLDALVSGTVSNDSAKFHELWPHLLAVIEAAQDFVHFASSEAEGLRDYQDLAAALAKLKASVGEGG